MTGIVNHRFIIHFSLLFCLLGLTFISNGLFGQKIGYVQYSLEEGLSEAEVRGIIQGKDGFVWVATRYGLNRFDGNEFTLYYAEDGLNDNKIQSLLEDKEGRIWIGTENGVNILNNGKLGSPAFLKALKGKVILSLFEDIQGRIWIGTDGFGAYLWNADREELIHFTTETGLSNDRVRDILQDADGIIWLGTRNGLNGYFNDNFVHYYEDDGLADNKIRALALSKKGELLIGTRGGLSIFDGFRFWNYGSKNGLYSEKITDIGVTTNNVFWLSTESGVVEMNEDSFRFFNLIDGLPVNIYQSVWIDPNNQPWFGSFGSGLIKLVGNQIIRLDAEFPFPERVIRSFAKESRRNLWVGTYGGGLVRLGTDFSVQSFRMSNGLTDDKIYSLLADENGVWIGTQGGLDYLNNDGIRTYYESKIPFRKIRDIEKTQNTLWLATFGDGLIQYDLESEQIKQFTAENSSLPGNTVEQVLKDQQGNIWVGTYSGIARIKDTQFKIFSLQEGLRNNAITHLFEDRSGLMWATTYKGFVYIDQNDQVTAVDESNGLDGSLCFFIQQDKWLDHIYWIGTNEGLVRFDKTAFEMGKDAFMLFDEKEGLLQGEFNEAAATWFNDRLHIGTVNGMMIIDTRYLKPETIPPKVMLADVRVMDLPIDSVSRKSLSHDQNFLHFSFTGIDFVSPSKLTYEYRLTPVETDYTLTSENQVRYSALPPGDYWFEVKAVNNSGLKTPKADRIHFVIHPPFWQQWWFLSLVLLLIVGVILFVYNYFRINRLVDIERMRVRIASDLHDDVGATLTEIALNTDFLMATNSSVEITEPLNQIGGLARNVVSSLDDIVWSIDARNDTAGDLGDRVQDTAAQIFRNTSTKLHFDFQNSETSRSLPVEVRENVYLIIKEAMNNAAKYANAANIWVRIQITKGLLNVDIEDDGLGLENHQNSRKGNGLLNMKMRAQRIAAKLHIKGNKGTKIQLRNIKI